MELKKREKSLFTIFVYHLILFCLLAIVSLFLSSQGFFSLIGKGYILPANYDEKIISQNRMKIESSFPFDENLLPKSSNYAIFDESGKFISGNMKENEIEKSKEILKRKSGYSLNRLYTVYRRLDGTFIAINYKMESRFSNERINNIITPFVAGIIWILFLFFVITLMVKKSLSRMLKKRLDLVLEVTNSINNDSLDYISKRTDIREFNIIIDALDKLKTALSSSLMKRWEDEQNRNLQISSMTHDIKTPLTIIRGNTEFLLEDEDDSGNIEILNSILKSEEKIEKYISITMEALSFENVISMDKKDFLFDELLQRVKNQSLNLCKIKNLNFVFKSNLENIIVTGDESLIERAILNIVTNAVEHTEKGKIILNCKLEDNFIKISCIDSGSGFSKEDLKNAFNYLYSSNSERSGKNYGLGLFVTKMIVENHSGRINIKNNIETGGAEVEIFLPFKL